MKEIFWGHIWKTRTEKLSDCVEMFWPTMGKKWTIEDCEDDISRSKDDGTIGKASKPIIYEVVLRQVEPTK
jgi:hypothetical protein